MSLQLVANHLAQKGRGPDSNLVHMSNREVAGLQALAKRHGGSLSVNPDTGLPEAGFLDNILPTIAGAGLTYFSGGAISPLMAAGIVGGISALDSKDLSKGLMAGLGAYGGAGLTAGLMTAGTGALTQQGIEAAGGAEALGAVPGGATGIAENVAGASNFDRLSAGAGQLFSNPGQTMQAIGGGSGYKAAGILGAAAAPMLADEMVETTTEAPPQDRGKIRPYTYSRQQAYPTQDYQGNMGSRERRYFNEGYTAGDPYAAANGGLVALAGGGDMRRRRGYEQQSLFTPTTPLPVNNMYGASRDAYDYLMGVNPTSGGQPYDPNRPFPPGMRGEIPENGMQPNPNTPKTGKGRYEFDPVTKQYKWVPDPIKPVDVVAPVFEAPERGGGGGDRGGGDEGTSGTSQGAYNVSRAGQAISTVSPYLGGIVGDYGDYLAKNVNPNYSNEGRNYPAPDYSNEGRNYPAPDFGLSPSDNDDSVGRGGYFGLSRSDNDDSVGRGDYSRQERDVPDAVAPTTDPFAAVSRQEMDVPEALSRQERDVPDAVAQINAALSNYSPSEDAGIAALNAAYANYSPSELAGTSALDSSYANYSPSELAGVSMTAPDVDPYAANIAAMTAETRDRINALMEASIRKDREAEAEAADAAMERQTTLDRMARDADEAEKEAANQAALNAARAVADVPLGEGFVSPASPIGGVDLTDGTGAGAFPGDGGAPPSGGDGGGAFPGGSGAPPSGGEGGGGYSGAPSGDSDVGRSAPGSAHEGAGSYGGEGGGGNQGGGEGGGYSNDSDRGDARGGYLQHGRFDQRMAHGGIAALTHQYNLGSYSDGGRLLKGPGDGVSDNIPATIGHGQPARLADGEFVIPARIVSELGNGSTDAGARALYKMMDRIQAGRRKTVGKDQVAKNSKAARHLPA